MTLPQYSFRSAGLEDLSVLRNWQSLPHVRKWWGDNDPFDENGVHDARVARWIVELNGKPFANMQDYCVHGWENHHFGHLPLGARGVEQYIGNPTMIGRGHGSAFLQQRLDELFDAGVPVVAVDPHPTNTRAIAAYQKVGFEIVGGERTTPWGSCYPWKLDDYFANEKVYFLGLFPFGWLLLEKLYGPAHGSE